MEVPVSEPRDAIRVILGVHIQRQETPAYKNSK